MISLFRCDTMRADISAKTCLSLQERDRNGGARAFAGKCLDCEVGRAIRETQGQEEIMVSETLTNQDHIADERKKVKTCKAHPDREVCKGSSTWCKECFRKYQREWYLKKKGGPQEELPKTTPEYDKNYDNLDKIEENGEMLDIDVALLAQPENISDPHSTPETTAPPGETLQQTADIQTQARSCSYHPDRPAHKGSQFCLECCQERARANARIRVRKKQERAAKDSAAHPDDYGCQEILFRWTLETLPPFNPIWKEEEWLRWWKVYGSLLETAKRLDGYGFDEAQINLD